MSTTVFVPKPFSRRPTFEQVLQASTGSRHLLLPPQDDQAFTIPSCLLDGFPIPSVAETESAERRKALYSQGRNAALFEPAKAEKKNTEIVMQMFIAEIKANRPKRSRWHDSDKETYEEKFVALISNGPQTMDSVVSEIEKTWFSWNERPHKLEAAKRNLQRFCETANSYTAVFDLIPNQSLYTGTLCGALKLLVNASINYEAMAEGFTRALAEIGQELATAKNLQALYETEEMSSVVISLYSHVLSFLQFSMKWIKSFGKTRDSLSDLQERFLSSFSDGGYWSQASKHLDPIKTLAQRVKNIASTAQMAENRDEHVKAENERKKQNSERLIAYCYFESLCAQQKQIMDAINDIRASRSDSATPVRPYLEQATPVTSQQSDSAQTPFTASSKSKARIDFRQYKISEILKSAQVTFAAYFLEIDVHHDLGQVQDWRSNLSKDMNLSPQAAKSIADWFGAKNATMLYIRSNNRAQKAINPTTGLSANIVTASRMARIPTLYFFCRFHLLSRGSDKPAVMILMSMIQQALEWLEEFDPNIELKENDFSQKRFDQAVNSAKGVWKLFEDVIGLLPTSPVIICDLLESYDAFDSEIRRLLGRFMSLIPSLNDEDEDEERKENEDEVGPKTMNSAYKILITSKRISSLLDEEIPDDITVNIRDMGKGRRQRGKTKQWLESAAAGSSNYNVNDSDSDSDSDSSEIPSTNGTGNDDSDDAVD